MAPWSIADYFQPQHKNTYLYALSERVRFFYTALYSRMIGISMIELFAAKVYRWNRSFFSMNSQVNGRRNRHKCNLIRIIAIANRPAYNTHAHHMFVLCMLRNFVYIRIGGCSMYNTRKRQTNIFSALLWHLRRRRRQHRVFGRVWTQRKTFPKINQPEWYECVKHLHMNLEGHMECLCLYTLHSIDTNSRHHHRKCRMPNTKCQTNMWRILNVILFIHTCSIQNTNVCTDRN